MVQGSVEGSDKDEKNNTRYSTFDSYICLCG
jgi:hypothetical protein